MAKVTVEDCLKHIENRFKLVLIASRRARQLSIHGAQSLIENEDNKSTVVALREIAAGYIFDNINDVDKIDSIDNMDYKNDLILSNKENKHNEDIQQIMEENINKI